MEPTERFQMETSDGIAAAVRGDTMISLWSAPALLERVLWHAKRVEKLAHASEGGFVLVMIILPTASPPRGEARVESNALTDRLGAKARLVATVAIGNTLQINVVRGVMRAMLLLSGHSKKLVVTATEAEALERVASVAGAATPPRSDLVQCIDALYASLGLPRAYSKGD